MRIGRTIGATTLVGIALAGAACSGGGSSADTSTTTGTSTTSPAPSGGESQPAETTASTDSTATGEVAEPGAPAGQDIGELLASEPGSPLPIEAGTYTASSFTAPLAFSLADVAIANGSLPNELDLTVGPDLNVRVTFLDEGVLPLLPKAKKQTSADLKFDEIPATTDALVRWFEKHPRLTASKPKKVTIGGVEGSEVELALKDGEGYRSDLCPGAEPCAPLFHTGPDAAASTGYVANTGSKLRVAVLEVDGRRVLVITEAKRSLDRLGKWSDELLETVTFGQ
jgi:hypothetical protein